VSFSRGTHDVVERGSQFQNLEAVLAEITIAANVPVPESEDMTKLVGQRACGYIAWSERHVPADEAVGGLSAAR
jgi:hypothetical protein